ncbi:MAG TPA: ribosome biogenesis GTPase Der, partial [Fibrobacteraceae bacterium]|nr:ribosome biogenesis GTPase Der [Fibrobacteraceae bacterium]
ILGRRAAVVADREGVTRDRHYQEADWMGTPFQLVDTGGFLPDDRVDVFADSVRQQIFAAIEQADLVLFMVDVRVGPQALDQQFARLVQKAGKPTLLVANKSEKEQDRTEPWAFLGLGLGEPRMVSALTGYAVRSLMEEVLGLLPKTGAVSNQGAQPDPSVIRFAVLGRPNAGKSTLLNRILGEDRLVVSDIPGTTRDSIDVEFNWQGRKFVVTDTAGLRKKAKVEDEVEVFSNMRTLESIRRSDVCVLLVDATRGLEIQDFRILEQIRQAGKGLVLLFNKWDILPGKDAKSFDHLVKAITEKETLLQWSPIIAISALEGQRVHRVVQEIVTVWTNCRRVLGRDRVAEVFQQAIQERPHPMRRSKQVNLERACQILVNPPVIAIETNRPELVDDSYRRYLMKVFFQQFSLLGAPLRLNFVRHLELRKDEELEQFGIASDCVSPGLDSDGRMDGEDLEGD